MAAHGTAKDEILPLDLWALLQLSGVSAPQASMAEVLEILGKALDHG